MTIGIIIVGLWAAYLAYVAIVRKETIELHLLIVWLVLISACVLPLFGIY